MAILYRWEFKYDNLFESTAKWSYICHWKYVFNKMAQGHTLQK